MEDMGFVMKFMPNPALRAQLGVAEQAPDPITEHKAIGGAKKAQMSGGAGTTAGTALSVATNPTQTVEEFKGFMRNVAGVWNNGDVANGLRMKTKPIADFLIKYLPLGGPAGITAAVALERLHIEKWTNVIASLIDFVSGKGNIGDFFNSLKDLVENLFESLKTFFQDVFVNKIATPIATGLVNAFNPGAMAAIQQRTHDAMNSAQEPREAGDRKEILKRLLSSTSESFNNMKKWVDFDNPDAPELNVFFDRLIKKPPIDVNVEWANGPLKLAPDVTGLIQGYIADRNKQDKSDNELFFRHEISDPILRRVATIPWLMWMAKNWATRPYKLGGLQAFPYPPALQWTEEQWLDNARQLPPDNPDIDTQLKDGTDDTLFAKNFGPKSPLVTAMLGSIDDHKSQVQQVAQGKSKLAAEQDAKKKQDAAVAQVPHTQATADLANFKKQWNFNKKVVYPKQGPLHKKFFDDLGITVEDWMLLPSDLERLRHLYRFQLENVNGNDLNNRAGYIADREGWQDDTQLPPENSNVESFADKRATMIDMKKPAPNARNMSSLLLSTPKIATGIAAVEAPVSFYQNPPSAPTAAPPAAPPGVAVGGAMYGHIHRKYHVYNAHPFRHIEERARLEGRTPRLSTLDPFFFEGGDGSKLVGSGKRPREAIEPTAAEAAEAKARADSRARGAKSDSHFKNVEERMNALSQEMFGKDADELDDDENEELDAAFQQQNGYTEKGSEGEDGQSLYASESEEEERTEVLRKQRPSAKQAARAHKYMSKLKFPARLAKYYAMLPSQKRRFNQAIRDRRAQPGYDVPTDEEDTEYEFDDEEEKPVFQPSKYFKLKGGAMTGGASMAEKRAFKEKFLPLYQKYVQQIGLAHESVLRLRAIQARGNAIRATGNAPPKSLENELVAEWEKKVQLETDCGKTMDELAFLIQDTPANVSDEASYDFPNPVNFAAVMAKINEDRKHFQEDKEQLIKIKQVMLRKLQMKNPEEPYELPPPPQKNVDPYGNKMPPLD